MNEKKKKQYHKEKSEDRGGFAEVCRGGRQRRVLTQQLPPTAPGVLKNGWTVNSSQRKTDHQERKGEIG